MRCKSVGAFLPVVVNVLSPNLEKNNERENLCTLCKSFTKIELQKNFL